MPILYTLIEHSRFKGAYGGVNSIGDAIFFQIKMGNIETQGRLESSV